MMCFKSNDQVESSPFTVFGRLTYIERDDTMAYGRNYYCKVMDHDVVSDDDTLWEGETDRYGYYESELLINDDPDGDDGNTRLDIYTYCRTRNTNLGQVVLHQQLRIPYAFYSETYPDVASTSIEADISVPSYDTRIPAMWTFEDLLRSYEYWNLFSGYNPAPVTAIWQAGVNSYRGCDNNSCFLLPDPPTYLNPEVFIKDQQINSSDTVVHEVSHAYVYNLAGSLGSCQTPHGIKSESSLNCAWSEGWADFLPLVVNGDGCYDFGLGPCGAPYVDLENAGYLDDPSFFNFGEAVEGRVAGALYDLVDDHDETLDVTGLPICLITDVILPAPLEQSFPEFWENWIDSGTGFESELDSVFFLNTVGSCVYLPVILWGGE